MALLTQVPYFVAVDKAWRGYLGTLSLRSVYRWADTTKQRVGSGPIVRAVLVICIFYRHETGCQPNPSADHIVETLASSH